MRKKIMISMIGLILIGANVYAAGDLVVNGKLGVGASNSGMYKAAIGGTNERGLSVSATSTTDNIGGKLLSSAYIVTLDGNVSTDYIIGQSAVLNMMSDLSGTVPGGQAATYTFQIGTPDTVGTTNVDQVVGLQYTLNRHNANTRTYNVTNSYGFLSKIVEGSSSGTAVNVTNHYHQYLDDPGVLSKVNITNLYGMYIKKMTAGANNYGLVLAGDGAGADIVFGASQQASIYSASGLLYAKDKNGNITQFSPHDPETGEWIYYSKNMKTGIIKRVNMEKLVKAVEKLTGEKFLVETLTEDK
jgi:hypothetical protein